MPLRPMHRVDQVVAVVGTVVSKTVASHLITVIAAAMATVIEMDTVGAARLELHDMTAVTNEEASPEAIENQSSPETEGMVEIETVTVTENEAIVTGMAAVDETMTLGRENDTTKVMGTMTREAKEGIKAHTTATTVSYNRNNGLSMGVAYVYGFPTFIYSTSRLSFNRTQRFVGGYLHLRLRLFESISSLLLVRG